jgi:hypothetical protein
MIENERSLDSYRQEQQSESVLTEEFLKTVRSVFSQIPDGAIIHDLYKAFRSSAEYLPKGYKNVTRKYREEYPEIVELHKTLSMLQRSQITRLLFVVSRYFDRELGYIVYRDVGFIRNTDLDTLSQLDGFANLSAAFLKLAFQKESI